VSTRARYLEALFRSGAQLGDSLIAVRTIGQLHVPSGRIIACDPFVPMDRAPFTTAVPTGTHPVELSIARFPNDDERIAAARLRWSEVAADSWMVALRDGEDAKTLESGRSAPTLQNTMRRHHRSTCWRRDKKPSTRAECSCAGGCARAGRARGSAASLRRISTLPAAYTTCPRVTTALATTT
jgi:hypothetical protein